MKAISFLWFPPTLQTERDRERPWLGVVTCLLESARWRYKINEFEGEGGNNGRFVSTEHSGQVVKCSHESVAGLVEEGHVLIVHAD